VAGLYAAQGMIDTIRSRIMIRVGRSLDESMSARVYDAIVRLPLKIGAKGDGTQPMRDLDTVRGFLSGSGPVAFFDLPWMPIFPHLYRAHRTCRSPYPRRADDRY
jgi:ABC-type protease/lipase transport system fused ATPase/permease subunit